MGNLLTGAEVVFKCLEDQKVEYIFGYPGGAVLPIYDELKKYLDNQMTIDQVSEIIAIRTRQYAKRQATWARSRMRSWKKIHPSEISTYIKKINKSSLKLDQLI